MAFSILWELVSLHFLFLLESIFVNYIFLGNYPFYLFRFQIYSLEICKEDLIFFQVEETTKYTVTERPGGRDVGVLMGPLIPPWRGKMCWLSADSSEAEFPYACL